MIGIVIISHSKKLAEGVKELAQQMSQNKVKIFAAGGIDDASNPIGTDPFKIKEAIELADSEEGILVLMDIGSAVMNAELATELLSDTLKERVLLCEAPLVEGAIAAAAQSMVGANLEAVAKEAKNSLLGKAALLGVIPEESKPPQNTIETGKEIKLVVPNKLGLHARPSVRLVELVNRFDHEVMVSVHEKEFVSARSISQVGTLGAKQGDTLVFKIQGHEFLELENLLKEFALNNFGDSQSEDQAEKKSENTSKIKIESNNKIIGVPASKGIAISTAKLLWKDEILVEKKIVKNTLEQKNKFRNAVKRVVKQVENIRHKTLGLFGKADAEIFDFHLLLLSDKKKLSEVEQLITQKYFSADYAWFNVFSDLEMQYQKMEDAYLQERASDVVEIRNKVLSEILESDPAEIVLQEPCILVVDEIGPAQTLSLNIEKVLGIISKVGGETSHATILARSLGIPSITGLGDQLDLIKDGDLIGIDGSTGVVYLDKTHPEKIRQLQEEKRMEEKEANLRFSKAKMPAISKDKVAFQILANVSSPKEAKIAFANGADGIGLYRTEFLYMNRDSPPTEEEQYQIYKQVCENMPGLPITIRTLDVGGDKPIPYLKIPQEANPFLGLRGIRYCLQNTEIFKTQLRAICRVSADHNVRIMYPMVSMIEELLAANKLLEEVRRDLSKENIPFSKDLKVGIMIEVPSVIFTLSDLAKELDFLSIGTNDLTQYLLAMDREAQIFQHYSALHPSVLAALKIIVKKADEKGLDLSLCGELASNSKATELLSTIIGLRKYSMSGPAIPGIKSAIRKMEVTANKYTSRKLSDWRTLMAVKEEL